MESTALSHQQVLSTLVPLFCFEDASIDSGDTLREESFRLGEFPKSTLVGGGTLVDHGDQTHLVTCNHVVERGGQSLCMVTRTRGAPHELVITFFSESAGFRNNVWVQNTDTDLAVTPFKIAQHNVRPIYNYSFCPRAILIEGWSFFYVGYPVHAISSEWYPAIRTGTIALVNHPQKHRVLVEATVAEGNSGGPAFVAGSSPNTICQEIVPYRKSFIGIVGQTLESEVDETASDRLKYVPGLSVVISSDAILEILRSDEYRELLVSSDRQSKT